MRDADDTAPPTEPGGDSLLVEQRGSTLVLTMNRPHRKNALSIDMIVRMADAWDLIEQDDSIRVAILTGTGSSYCVGGDLSTGWMTGGTAPATELEARAAADPSLIGRGLLLTRWLRKPLVAVVNGACLGGGCEMLQQTDIRVAEEHATFGVPEARRGLMAGAGSTVRLKRQIPYAVAMEMLLTGRMLTADEALRWGLVTHVVPTGDGFTRGLELAAAVEACAPLSVTSSKAAAIESGWLPDEEGRAIEARYTVQVMRSEDAKEGMRAFVEKRTPNYSGR